MSKYAMKSINICQKKLQTNIHKWCWKKYKNTLLLWFVYGIKFTNGGNKMNDEEKILKLLNNNNGVIKTSEVTDKKMKKMYYIN